MSSSKRPKIDLQRRLNRKRHQRIFLLVIFALFGSMAISLLFNLTVRLPVNSQHSVDAILVLGGSIQREFEAAKIARQIPEIPIIISQGSANPCLRRLFDLEGARSKGIWLERCANSTFGNFFFSAPILRRWRVHKVLVITSPTHLPRAQLLAHIHLWAQGIALQMEVVQESGIPGNREWRLKTYLDVTRSAIWALFSQVIQPPCFDFVELDKIDLNKWNDKKFNCEKNL